MSAANSVTPPSATPSVPPQGLPFPPPQSATASVLTNAGANMTPITESTVAPPLPPPQTFDILPPLHALLSRLEPSLNTYTTDPITTHNASVLNPITTGSATTSFDSNAAALNASLSGLAAVTQSQSAATSAPLTQLSANQQAALAYKDVVSATQPLRAKMRRALAELAKLGDMERGVEEQEEELEELTRRIEGQRVVLGKLAELAGQAGYAGDGAGEVASG